MIKKMERLEYITDILLKKKLENLEEQIKNNTKFVVLRRHECETD